MSQDKDKPVILAICGKSASGKDTLAKWIYKNRGIYNRNVNMVVSDTTRPKRINETYNVDYCFISDSAFTHRINRGYYIEYTNFKGWRYGIPIDKLDVNPNALNVVVVNPQGLAALSRLPSIFTIIPVYLQLPLGVRFRNAIDRENGFRFEQLRRIIVDAFDFRNIKDIMRQFKYRIIMSKYEDGVLRRTRIINHYMYLRQIISLPMGGFQ